MVLPWDFVLFLYRQETGASWMDLVSGAIPRWRIERDLAYLGLRDRARAYQAKQQATQEWITHARDQARGRSG